MKNKIQYQILLALLFATTLQPLSAQNKGSENHDSNIGNDSPNSLIVPESGAITMPPDSTLPIRDFIRYVDPKNPDIPKTTNNYAVGTPAGALSVSETGAAEYTLTIDCPEGGNLAPQINISYNSQNASVGLAGYGFSINGMSAITRGGKTLFDNAGTISGVTYTSSDNLYLDGKRLILLSGSPCQEKAAYCLEGDPYTTITAHGTYNDNTATTWFEVTTADGKIYHYGNTADSRISYNNSNNNPRIASWYVDRIEDVYGNYISYSYSVRNLYAYPIAITYGKNKNKDRGLTNKIVFEYSGLPNPVVFNLEDQKGKIDQCVSAVTTSLNGTVYRKYRFTYDSSSDKSICKFSRLTKIQEENGAGDSMPPVQFKWSPLPSGDIYSTSLSIPTTEGNSFVEELDRNFIAADLNGDGISDIVRVSPVRVTDYIDSSNKQTHDETRVYISRSTVSSSGSISYLPPIVFTLPAVYTWDDFDSSLGGSALMDMDGDGYNDLIFPFHDQVSGMWNSEVFYTILGSDVVSGNGGAAKHYAISLRAVEETPLFVTSDFNNDGKDEVLCIEQALKDGLYPASLVKMKEDKTLDYKEFSFSFSAKPEKLFCGDYNNDGLTDIIVLYNGGYKIYYNNGGTVDTLKFSESNIKTGTNLADQWRVRQGDFDGDGLLDFVYFVSGETWLWIARNNGNGTFTCTKTDDIGIGNHSSSKDDNRFAVMVYDIDRDGKSDVMICKAGYVHHGFPTFKNEYTDTQIRWLFSNGTTLKLSKSKVKNRENDANESSIFLGDFTGDGNMELANYGSNLDSTTDTFVEDKIYVYRTTSYLPATGRITQITDGMENITTVEYANTTSPAVYTRTKSETQYPVNTYTLPLSVVRSITSTNGVAGNQTTEYSYKDLKIHMRGRGPLGFVETESTNKTTGENSVKRIVEWDTARWIPTKIRTVNTIGDKTTTATVSYTVKNIGNTYIVHESESTITDMDGNTAVTSSVYDSEKGVILSQVVSNDGDAMYKKVEYSGYQKKGGRWLPSIMKMTQKHSDDPDPYVSETRYSYDEKGNVLTNTVNYGTTLALTSTAAYDTYGNCLSSVLSGKDVKSVTSFNEYDASGRFVVKSYSNPASSVNTFTYDKWGNVLTENDITDPSNILTTTNTYDNWGRLISSVQPDGSKTVQSVGWGTDNDKKYYTLTETSEKPWVLTWYDNAGHEISQETFGPQNVLISKSTEYNSLGQVSKVKNISGKFINSETFAYDDYGRIQSHIAGTGSETVLSYGNRSVTTTVDGKAYTKVSDAWGNILSSSDPAGNTVEYVYSSNGKPVEITTGGSAIAISYDEAGNRISLTDPDAGTVTSEYSADGKLISQTDARGILTQNTFDDLGRISTVRKGTYTLVNTYGTSGNSNLRLVKQEMAGNSIEFTYDNYGRVITEKRNVRDNGSYSFAYKYDSKNRLEKTTYPGDLDVVYSYDDYGFRTAATAAGYNIYTLKKYEGLSAGSSVFMDTLTTTVSCDSKGFQCNRSLVQGNKRIESLQMNFDHKTGNLLSRQRNLGIAELFSYDNLDRLTTVKESKNTIIINPDLRAGKIGLPVPKTVMSVTYGPGGNILSKTGVGNYTYNDAFKPHAVVSVDNDSALIPASALSTVFNDLNKISSIEDDGEGNRMIFRYGPDEQRWYSQLTKGRQTIRSTVYAGNYEKIIEEGITREFYYLDGGTVLVREWDILRPYVAFTDHLGSILSVVDAGGEKVFDASYDAWGRQSVTLNRIGLYRGYTGHEMIPEFGIINMNGRLYDPVLGRFFSPDNYVQLPDFSQSYNRYSYCLNNPLKYTDPSGELFGIDDALIAFAFFNTATSMMKAAINGDNIWKAGALNLLSSAAAYGIGSAFAKVNFFGKELLRAGAHGLSGGLFSMLGGGSFGAGLASGAISSGLGSYLQRLKINENMMVLSSAAMGGVAAWATGGKFLQGALNGMTVGLFNHGAHPGEIYRDENGELHCDLPEFECIGKRQTYIKGLDGAITVASWTNTVIDAGADSFKKYAQNTTFGSNYKFYFHTNDQQPFRGNQYVKTIHLQSFGSKVGKVTGVIGLGFDFYNIRNGYLTDKQYYDNNNYYYTARASGEVVGGWVGAYYGAAIGAEWGAIIGAHFYGIGILPGMIIGSIVGGMAGSIAGTFIGSKLGTATIDNIYGK